MKVKIFILSVASLVIGLVLIVFVNAKIAEPTIFESNIKVAFIGDQGRGDNPRAVLRLIKQEGASLVVHAGDFDYEDNPDAWEKAINKTLGKKFPYIASVGNHEVGPWWLFYYPWPDYQKKLINRLKRTPIVKCSGDIAVKSLCRYKGLVFVFSGVDVLETGHSEYISEKLSQNPDAVWKICSWHKNQEEMQVGGKGDQVGWGIYEACRQHGAIIATAHSHIYARTKTLIDMTNQVIDPNCSDSNVACVKPGKTFSFVSGLGGHSTDTQERCFDGCKGEWASIYTGNQNAVYGALFIIFNYQGDPYRAHGYFKNINGVIIDEFDILAEPPAVSSSEQKKVFPLPITPPLRSQLRYNVDDVPSSFYNGF